MRPREMCTPARTGAGTVASGLDSPGSAGNVGSLLARGNSTWLNEEQGRPIRDSNSPAKRACFRAEAPGVHARSRPGDNGGVIQLLSVAHHVAIRAGSRHEIVADGLADPGPRHPAGVHER